MEANFALALKSAANRHIFSRFRHHVRLWASLVFIGFSFFDYLYRSDYFTQWLFYRIITVVAVNLLFFCCIKLKSLRKKMESVAVAVICLYCWPIAIMIFDSGGYKSIYITGLILCGTTGLQLFRLRGRMALYALTIAYLPAIVVIFNNIHLDELKTAILQSGFLIGMVVLSSIYSKSEDQVDRWWMKFRRLANDEIQRLRKTEILKNHFPQVIRETFEKNPEKIFMRKIFPNAVVGFADIVSSSQLSNNVSIPIDWSIKERFLEAATRRAIESEMVVLTHMGDGFLFLANYNESSQWYYNLISFYENLITDFKNIYNELNLSSTGVHSGVKFGVSSGPVMVGFLGTNQSYFTAIGSDVNLASRLCSIADTDQIVLSSRVWHSIQPLLLGWHYTTKTYDNIKGFNYPISAVHISPRTSDEHQQMICARCNKSMSLIKTEEGFLDYRCEEGHNTPLFKPLLRNNSSAS